MKNSAISDRSPPVVIEYDSRGERTSKTFEDGYAPAMVAESPVHKRPHPCSMKCPHGVCQEWVV